MDFTGVPGKHNLCASLHIRGVAEKRVEERKRGSERERERDRGKDSGTKSERGRHRERERRRWVISRVFSRSPAAEWLWCFRQWHCQSSRGCASIMCLHFNQHIQCQWKWRLYLAPSMAPKGTWHRRCKHNMQVSTGIHQDGRVFLLALCV